MFKFVFSAVMAVALCCPMISAAQDCGCCEPAPVCAPKTRKKLALVDVSREVCRLKSACVTDECGCSKKTLVAVKECVTRKRLALVDVEVDPCRKNCFQKLREKLAECREARQRCKPDPCCAPAPAPAPCCAPAPCGCGCN